MCTLTYVPTKDGFIVTSNRDEGLQRGLALPPAVYTVEGRQLLFPKDPDKSGSWIAASDSGRVAVILNGAFARHKHQPHYRKSRGLVLLDSFAFDDLSQFAGTYDFAGIEPFALIAMNDDNITDVRWDGNRSHVTYGFPWESRVWCSAQMYSIEIQSQTVDRFKQFLENNPSPSAEDLALFNRDEEYETKMERAGETPFPFLKTVSVSSVELSGRDVTFRYTDRITQEEAQYTFPLK